MWVAAKRSGRRTALPLAINAACFFGSFNAMAQSADLPKFNEFAAGDSWQFSMIIKNGENALNLGERRYAVKEISAGKIMFDEDSPDYETLYLNGGNPAADLTATDEQGRKGAWRLWPLAVGKTWRFVSIEYMPTLQPLIVIQNVVVAGYGDVKVPAGTFKAFRIEHRGTFCIGCMNVPRNKVIPSNVKLEKTANDTYWYSPEVRMDIKKIEVRGDREFTMELSGFSRQK